MKEQVGSVEEQVPEVQEAITGKQDASEKMVWLVQFRPRDSQQPWVRMAPNMSLISFCQKQTVLSAVK